MLSIGVAVLWYIPFVKSPNSAYVLTSLITIFVGSINITNISIDNMKRVALSIIIGIVLLVSCNKTTVTREESRAVYVDDNGVMRWSDTKEEAVFWGVNYTTPFAYAYRALDKKGVDHKEAIRRDVYHIARLGFNAFRLHVWDVEISDSVGNLLDNEHLDLLDYLVAEVEKRGISTVLTLQTNFGNGYPERNINTGAYSYLYEKCNMHSDPKAQDAQRNYLTQFMRHRNRYTGKIYGADNNIVGFEVNNEPCHRGKPEETLTYINSMVEAMKSAGCERPIFYNASHNGAHVKSYFAADIDGATYQWYPSGLVAGRERKGNFLPVVDRYVIPFDTIEGFSDKAKIIYEFDPADISYAHVYPAVARAFRGAGFSWVTQFSYDPIDIAECNTEYQTHYMNLAYTPSKAISLMIAGEVMRNVKGGETFGEYPADTLFSHCVVSYKRDLSVWNSGDKYINSNESKVEPSDNAKLEQVVGVGSSPVVCYNGTGAYFLDRLEDGVWRLEVMPDAVPVADAYEKASPSRRVVELMWKSRDMKVSLADLTQNYVAEGVTKQGVQRAEAGVITVEPGVYILRRDDDVDASRWSADVVWRNIKVGEYVAPERYDAPITLVHTPKALTKRAAPMEVTCRVLGEVDSVVLSPQWVSFWSDRNPSLTMKAGKGYTYETEVPSEWLKGDDFGYYITVYGKSEVKTYPSASEGAPLDWDARVVAPYITKTIGEGESIKLIASAADDGMIDTYSLPHWRGIAARAERNMPMSADVMRYTFDPKGEEHRYFIRKYVGEELKAVRSMLDDMDEVTLYCGDIEGVDQLNVTLISDMGIAYTATVDVTPQTQNIVVKVGELKQSPVALLPIAYPAFSSQYFETSEQIPFAMSQIEHIEISTPAITERVSMSLAGVVVK